MPLKLLLDENLRSRSIQRAISRHQLRGEYLLDIACVGEPPCVPLGTSDESVIAWAASKDRVLLSLDARTLPQALAGFTADGNRSPGIVLLRDGLSVSEVVDLLVLIAYASDTAEWENMVRWLP